MFKIDKNNNITLTKGDTATLLVEVFDNDGYKYDIKNTDEVKMAVRNKAGTVMTKTANSNHVVSILPSDTSSLTAGWYKYDIQLTTANANVYTVVPLSDFELQQEVAS